MKEYKEEIELSEEGERMLELLTNVLPSILSLAGVCFAAVMSSRKTGADVAAQLDKAQAVTDERLTELTRAVREHNNFARRMPVVEEQIRVLKHRIKDLEQQK